MKKICLEDFLAKKSQISTGISTQSQKFNATRISTDLKQMNNGIKNQIEKDRSPKASILGSPKAIKGATRMFSSFKTHMGMRNTQTS